MKLMRYLSWLYDHQTSLHTLVLAQLQYASMDSLLYLLPQLFQGLWTESDNLVENFFVEISHKWPSLTHNMIWMCDVETQVEQNKKWKRKVELEREDNIPETSKRIIDRIIGNMSVKEKHFYEAESEFFEKITAISALLQPKQPKPEKKQIIKEWLLKY